MIKITELYNKTAERLWEKLEFYRNKIDTSCVDFNEPFPIDQLTKGNPFVYDLIQEVQDEFEYEMSEFQGSWCVVQFICGGLKCMDEYNKKNNTNLSARK